MGKVKLLLDVIGDLRSLADSLQAVADAVADSGAAEAEMTTTKEPEETGKAGRAGKTAKNTAKKEAKAAKQEPEEKPLTLDTRVVEMDEELSAMFRDDLKEYYGYTDQELNDLKPFLMVEPRGFTAIRVFCGAGVAAILVGVILLVMRWRKISAQIRQSREEMPGPDLD